MPQVSGDEKYIWFLDKDWNMQKLILSFKNQIWIFPILIFKPI